MAGAGTCTACKAPIVSVFTVGGKLLELDPEPSADGNIIATKVLGQPRARVLTGNELPAQEPAWTPHLRTCPNSPDARRRQAASKPRCTACRLPMDPDLARLEDWTTHPACDRSAR